MTILTRGDCEGDVTITLFDSIKWAFETHLGEKDTGEFNYAILHGNEDCPLRIQFWREAEPNWQDEPDRVWDPKIQLTPDQSYERKTND